MSIKKWDGSLEYIAYMHHEDKGSKLINVGISDDDERKAQETNKKVQKKIKANTPQAICQRIFEYLQEETMLPQFAGVPETRMVVTQYVRILAEKDDLWAPNNYQMERYVDMVKRMCARANDKMDLYQRLKEEEYMRFFDKK